LRHNFEMMRRPPPTSPATNGAEHLLGVVLRIISGKGLGVISRPVDG